MTGPRHLARRLAALSLKLVTAGLIAGAASAAAPDIGAMNQPHKPFQIYGNTYYVGMSGIASLLMSLFGRGGSAFAGDLCASLAQSPANLTRIGDALVERGYVSRDPDLTDRRRMLLTLLPEGERMLREMLPEVSAQFGALFEGFSRSEKTQLLAGLKKLLAGIDALDLREAQEDGAP